MLRSLIALLAVLAAVTFNGPASAQSPMPLLPQATGEDERIPADEPPPGFDPLVPIEEPEPEAVKPEPEPEPEPEPILQPAPLSQPVPQIQPAPLPALPAPVIAPAEPAAPADWSLPSPVVAVLIVLGAFTAALFGVIASMLMRRSETKRRRRAAAINLATELETRRQAFEAVPLPPNVEAGVFFVSAVTSLASVDAAFRAAQADLHLMPGKLAANVSVHYAAVQRVADFVKGQSLAAAVRMLQANRLGGYPCPDSGTMRDAHEELAVAFRGIDKLIAHLNVQAS